MYIFRTLPHSASGPRPQGSALRPPPSARACAWSVCWLVHTTRLDDAVAMTETMGKWAFNPLYMYIHVYIYICINIYIHKLNYIYQEYIYIFICIESRGWLFNPMVSPSWCATPYLCWLTPCFLQFVSNVFSIFLVETRVCLKSSSESMIVVV